MTVALAVTSRDIPLDVVVGAVSAVVVAMLTGLHNYAVNKWVRLPVCPQLFVNNVRGLQNASLCVLLTFTIESVCVCGGG